MPWLIVGDYNAVLYSHERSSDLLGSGNKDVAIRSFVQSSKLVGLGFLGPCFTWVQGIPSNIYGECKNRDL